MSHNFRRDVANIQKQLIALKMELNKLGVWDQSGIIWEDFAWESAQEGSLHVEMQAIKSDLAKLIDDSAKATVSVMEGVVATKDDLVDMGRRFVAIHCRLNRACECVQVGKEILDLSSKHESI